MEEDALRVTRENKFVAIIILSRMPKQTLLTMRTK